MSTARVRRAAPGAVPTAVARQAAKGPVAAAAALPAAAPPVAGATPAAVAPRPHGLDSREEILRGAAELFMEFGYAATSLDAVAERLGSTKGRIYHHYRSKADLFIDVQVAAMTRLQAAIEPIARGPGSAVERLTAMALQHTLILLTDLPMQKVAVQGLERHLLASQPAVRRLWAVIRMRDDYEALFAEVIDEGMRDGVLIDLPAQLATKPFFGAMNWATVWYSQRRLQGAQAIEEIARTLAECATRGLMRTP